MDMSEWVPKPLWRELAWLSKLPGNWCQFQRDDPDNAGNPRSIIPINADLFMDAPGWNDMPGLRVFFERIRKTGNPVMTAYLEAVTCMFADGPKIFHPTTEQFESMEWVELSIPPAEFRSPYRVITVSVPEPCRRRLSAEYGVPFVSVPRAVLVRDNREPWNDHAIYITMTTNPLELTAEHYLFMEHPENNPVERALSRYVDEASNVWERPPDNLKRVSTILARAALNLCMMLTHYGHREGGPNDPTAYARHRAKRHLRHFAHGDYTTVLMKQNIVVRAPSAPASNPPGDGTGIELKPHWRRGHWRCYPGHAAERAAGVRVPLLFVRPCLVRPDRVVGDMVASRVEYHG